MKANKHDEESEDYTASVNIGFQLGCAAKGRKNLKILWKNVFVVEVAWQQEPRGNVGHS